MTFEATVLCVDDEPRILSALQRMLGWQFVRVLRALDGGEALELIECPAIKVVVADQRMPGMSGSELMGEIRRRRPDVGRIILTAYPGPDVVVRSLEAQVDFLIAKPWNEDALRRAIWRLIDEVDRARTGDPWRDLGGEAG
jgi:CheY-like chemotaxis protein